MSIDRIFIINLDSRPDRWEKIEQQLKDKNITNYERFSAIRPTDKILKNHKFFLRKHDNIYRIGTLGCLLSHYDVIKLAKQRKYTNILILEDDTEFLESFDNFDNFFNSLLSLDSEFKMCYLSGSHIEPYINISTNIAKVNKTYTTGSYIINCSLFNHVLEKLIDYHCEVDKFYANEIQPKFNCYCFIPHLTKQSDGFSDIQQKTVSYKLNY